MIVLNHLFFFFVLSICFIHRAFLRILCVCCPRKIRRKYQPTMRSKASQVTIKRHIIHSNGFICLMLQNMFYFISYISVLLFCEHKIIIYIYFIYQKGYL